MGNLVTTAIALGSNLGDRAGHLAFAVSRLRDILKDLRVSSTYETMPVGVEGAQPLFLNAVAVGAVESSARELLDALLVVEQERARMRSHPNAPRTLDLDLILFGAAIIDEPGLIVPHPRFRERRFVLEPLAEVAPHLVDPVTGSSAAELLERLHLER